MSFIPAIARTAGNSLIPFLAVGTLLHGLAQADTNFERNIRPILSENCFQCHGPDEAARKAGLRLDSREAATADLGGRAAIVPGRPEQSELLARITHADPEERMPPPSTKKSLSEKQIEALRTWIAQGAEWPVHWAFVPPVRPRVPAVSRPEWTRNPIDAFIMARLDQEGLHPAPEADPLTLLRRASLDVIGLPPTLDDIARGESYEESIERLLASPHYGERWARPWLDAAQYADSDGFEKDKPRQVWAWRDWVINAFNSNMPYDRFVQEQIAGDLLPNATQDQIIATGFLRNSMINEEGGIDPEQFRMEALFNRMDVIGRAVLGLTVNCAQCHTHKYDPITQTDYYRMLAFINNAYEACITVYTPEERRQREETLARAEANDEALRAAHPDWPQRMAAWEARLQSLPQPTWHTLELTFDDTSAGGQKCLPQGDGSYLAQGYAPTRFHPKSSAPSPLRRITAVQLELLTDDNLPRGGPGRSIYGAGALSEFEFRMAPPERPFEEFDQWDRATIAGALADVNPPKRPLGPEFPDKGKRKAFTGPIAMAIDGNLETAWSTDNGPERRNQPRHAIFMLAQPLEVPEGWKLGIKLIQNHGGWNSDDNQNNNLGRFRISVTDSENLPDTAVPLRIREILQRTPAMRRPAEQQELFRYWRSTVPGFALANLQFEKIWSEMPNGATQLVYREMPTPRTTHRLDRGDFLAKAEIVSPGLPAFLNPPPADAPPNRLALARWITDRRAPTTARVFVNRVWQHYFGTGLVATPSDFGSQGEAPSHPELLDWLAVEFMDSGWDIKALHRLILTSATYRQSARVTPELLERDPANRLLARGARFRVDGEIVRDIALAASGLLNPRIGGPSVYPPAPDFLFEPPASYGPKPWPTATGADQYRRALYTFRFRSVPYPALQAFDTPPGDAPCVRRVRSNTPLQALTTLNEPVFMECAAALAARTLAEGGTSDDARIEYAYRRCVARPPEAEERATLLAFLDKQRTRLARGELNPAELLKRDADQPLSDTDRELAAWTLTARILLNLDETITRE